MRSLCLIILSLTLLPSLAFASTVVRSGDAVSVTAEQTVEGDFYGLGNTVAISGIVEEDLLVMAERITINGEVGADLAALAVSVDVDGLVADDVRVVGGQVTIKGEITGNLVVVASELTILSTARVSGDVLFFGGEADISGYVGGDVLGTAALMRVDGEVAGGVDVTVESLTLGERANITQGVTYSSASELTRSQNAQVGGQIVKNDRSIDKTPIARVVLIPFLISLFATLVWYLLFRNSVVATTTLALAHPLRSTLIGFGFVFLVPISITILILSTLGIVVGLALLTFYFFALSIAFIMTGSLVGTYLATTFTKKPELTVLWIVGGVITIHALMYIPVLGGVLVLWLLLLTLGAFSERSYNFFRS
jgi:cytoskeletal protein CcmA (bactofilin family)